MSVHKLPLNRLVFYSSGEFSRHVQKPRFSGNVPTVVIGLGRIFMNLGTVNLP